MRHKIPKGIKGTSTKNYLSNEPLMTSLRCTVRLQSMSKESGQTDGQR